MQANCAQCHTDENFAGTPLVKHGRELFFEKGCYGCHRIQGLSHGTLGPDLTEVGKKWRIDYLWGHTVNPRAYSAVSFMPKFDLNDDEIKALVVFLKSRRGMNFAETTMQQYLAKQQNGAMPAGLKAVAAEHVSEVARGEQLITQRACTACHKLADKDGHISPDLSFEALIRDQNWLMDHFKEPRSRIPDSIMPVFGFSEGDYSAMTAYLMSRNTAPKFNNPAEIYKGLCARCHGEKGDGMGVTHIYLDPAPRDLTKAEFMSTKPEERFLQSLRDGVPGTSMPPWARVLTDQQRKDVLTYVFATFVKKPAGQVVQRKVPEVNPVAYSLESVAEGEKLFLQRCTGCHGRKADGKGPNSLDISPRPRNLRNSAFINNVPDKRLFNSILYGVQGTAMPPWIDYDLTTNDVGKIINFIRSMNPKPAPAPVNEKTPKLTTQLNQEAR